MSNWRAADHGDVGPPSTCRYRACALIESRTRRRPAPSRPCGGSGSSSTPDGRSGVLRRGVARTRRSPQPRNSPAAAATGHRGARRRHLALRLIPRSLLWRTFVVIAMLLVAGGGVDTIFTLLRARTALAPGRSRSRHRQP